MDEHDIASSESDEADDNGITSKLHDIARKADGQRLKLGTAFLVYVYDRASAVALVELNES